MAQVAPGRGCPQKGVMQLACPACAATYQVPDALIGDGRQMRCVRCGEAWFARAVGEAPGGMDQGAGPPPLPNVTPHLQPLASAEKPVTGAQKRSKKSLALLLAWAGSIALWLGGLYGFWVARDALAGFWPPLGRLYAALGLA